MAPDPARRVPRLARIEQATCFPKAPPPFPITEAAASKLQAIERYSRNPSG